MHVCTLPALEKNMPYRAKSYFAADQAHNSGYPTYVAENMNLVLLTEILKERLKLHFILPPFSF